MFARAMVGILCGLAVGCDDDGGGGTDVGGQADTSAGGVTCTVTAEHEVPIEPGPKTLSATGTITCTGPSALELEVCVELDGSDVMCRTASDSGATTLTRTAEVGCVGTKTVRAHVRATIAGTLEDHYSEIETVDCRF